MEFGILKLLGLARIVNSGNVIVCARWLTRCSSPYSLEP
jgi:hypothetical protein